MCGQLGAAWPCLRLVGEKLMQDVLHLLPWD